MGKGGEKKQLETKAEEELQDALLAAERKAKMEESPGFFWDEDSEPHALRRREIQKAHPEVATLMGHDSSTVYKILFAIFLQFTSLHLLQGAPWYTWLFLCYTLSGTINHAMTLAMHEASHNLCAKKFWKNKVILILANLPMGIPSGASFKRYHLEHHKFQGEHDVDVDIPTNWEGFFFTSSPRKALWCFLQPLFYSIRPLIVSPKKISKLEVINILACLVFDAIILHLYGPAGLAYLCFGTLLGMGLHPVAGHFIAEHYVMRDGQETYSYYGPLNWLTFNVGYHNEHHDFAYISGKNLASLRNMAPEYYDTLAHHHSWVKVIYDYIMNPSLSPFSRTKRVTMQTAEIQDLKARGGLCK